MDIQEARRLVIDTYTALDVAGLDVLDAGENNDGLHFVVVFKGDWEETRGRANIYCREVGCPHGSRDDS